MTAEMKRLWTFFGFQPGTDFWNDVASFNALSATKQAEYFDFFVEFLRLNEQEQKNAWTKRIESIDPKEKEPLAASIKLWSFLCAEAIRLGLEDSQLQDDFRVMEIGEELQGLVLERLRNNEDRIQDLLRREYKREFLPRLSGVDWEIHSRVPDAKIVTRETYLALLLEYKDSDGEDKKLTLEMTTMTVRTLIKSLQIALGEMEKAEGGLVQ